jgi:hypothetical protein
VTKSSSGSCTVSDGATSSGASDSAPGSAAGAAAGSSGPSSGRPVEAQAGLGDRAAETDLIMMMRAR